MKKWAYPLMIAFVAFLVFSNPASAGTHGRQFVIWLGDLAGAAGEFLDGLFDESGDSTTDNILTPTTGDTSGATGTTIDSGASATTQGTTTATDPGSGDGSEGDSSDEFGTIAPVSHAPGARA